MKFNPENINLNEDENVKEQKGKLFLVSTPIGNNEDITLRALRILKMVDLVVCEEFKVGAALLHKHSITRDLDNLNEQNELEKVIEFIQQMKDGKRIALISDCGTPVFADPGASLVKAALKAEIEIEVVPGATSIMTALVRSGLDISSFLFAGFLSRKTDDRLVQLEQLSQEKRTVVLLETPYRFSTFLQAAAEAMPNRKAYIGMNLTAPSETHHYGTFLQLQEKFGMQKIKTEFVVCFDGSYGDEKKINRELFEAQREEKREYKEREPQIFKDKFGNPVEKGRFGREPKPDRKKSDRRGSDDRRPSWGSRDGGFKRDDNRNSDRRRDGERPERRSSDRFDSPRGGSDRDRGGFGRSSESRPYSSGGDRFSRDRDGGSDRRSEDRPYKSNSERFGGSRDNNSERRSSDRSFRPSGDRFSRDRDGGSDRRSEDRPYRPNSERFAKGRDERPDFKSDERPERSGGDWNDSRPPRNNDERRPSGVRSESRDRDKRDGRSGGRKNSR